MATAFGFQKGPMVLRSVFFFAWFCRDCTPVNKHSNGKSPFSMGNTSWKGAFFIAVEGGGRAVRGLRLHTIRRYCGGIRTLQWDVDGFGPTERDIGVTWCELGLSFAIFAKMLLPIQRKNADGTVMIIFPNSAEEAENLTYSFSDLAISMFQFWTAFHSLSFGCSPIVLTKGPQYSLTLLGFRSQGSGVRPRPWFPGHSQVIPFVAKNHQWAKY